MATTKRQRTLVALNDKQEKFAQSYILHRNAIESDAQRRIELIDSKLSTLETKLREMLQRALDNPLAGQ